MEMVSEVVIVYFNAAKQLGWEVASKAFIEDITVHGPDWWVIFAP